MRGLAVIFLVIAVTLIAVGRVTVRRAGRGHSRRGRALGWLFTLAGFVCMLVGVTIW